MGIVDRMHHSDLSPHTAFPQETALGDGKKVGKIWVQVPELPPISQIS